MAPLRVGARVGTFGAARWAVIFARPRRWRGIVVAVACVTCSRPAERSGGDPDVRSAVPIATAAPREDTEISADAAAASAPETESQNATVTLLDPGHPPRRKLRYAWNVQQKEELTMDLRTSLSNELGDAKQPDIALPPVHVVVAIDPQAVSIDGADGPLLTYAWRVTSASTADAETPPQVAEGMRTEVAAVAHLAGTGEVDALGLSRRVSAGPVAVSEAGATGQMVEQIKQTLRDVAAPLPLEPVGLGARWRKLSRLAAEDARISQSDTFTLTELAGEAGTVDDVLAQTAPPQVLRAPGAPQGAQARMESMLASGDAKTHFRLSRLVPQTKFDGTTTMVVSGATPEPARKHMTMTLRVQIVLSGSTR